MRVSEIPFIAHLRGNHALEHATMHVLSEETPHGQLLARTTPSGFILYGDVTAEAVTRSAREALSRLRAGQRHLAVHPNCGTNIATAGILAGFGAFLALETNRGKSRWDRLSQALWATTLGVLIAQPLGRLIQAWLTTSPDVDGACIAGVTSHPRGRFTQHDVAVRWS
jgi:hypothetical protein